MTEKHQTRRNLLITIFLNVIITIAQIIGGIISGSLALISDALHNLSDSVAIILAYIAHIFSKKPRTSRSTFGFQRAEILAAFINSLVLIGISVYLLVEAFNRFINLREVNPVWMFWLGLLGFVANGISVFILHGERKENINLKAAYLHLLGDALTSLSVIAGAICIWAFGWFWIDPLVTVFISVYLFVHTVAILKDSVGILMQMAPSDMDTKLVADLVALTNGVCNVHHVHIWKLSDKKIHFEGHIVLSEDIFVSDTAIIHENIKEVLKEKFDIEHITLQFEFKNKPEIDCE